MTCTRSKTEVAALILMLNWVCAAGPPVLLASSASFSHPAPQRRTQEYSPGKLESFLAAHKSAAIREHELGRLAGRDMATITALIAWDPAEPDRKLTGVRIRLQKGQGGPEETAYLDSSGLECADRIQGLALRRDQIAERFRVSSPSQKDWSVVVFANNRRESDGGELRNVTALNVGWYRMGDEFGVVVRSLLTSREYLFPDAELASLASMLSAGRSYLQSPDPRTDRDPGASQPHP